jgi:2'-5' RNA ligase
VPAHTTLFQTLPGAELAQVSATLATIVSATPAFAVAFPTLRRLTNGVAIVVEAEPLPPLHSALAAAFAAWLTPPDREPFAPHVTIMNKRTPAVASAAYNQLLPRWESFDGVADGLALWHYRGGPWEPAARLAFAAPP